MRKINKNNLPMTNIVAIIPARIGSKGLPRKNILPLAGKPLISYTIEAAKNSKLVSRVIVSTDDEEIKKTLTNHFDWIVIPGKEKNSKKKKMKYEGIICILERWICLTSDSVIESLKRFQFD